MKKIIDEIKIDLLKEIGNIGMGNAASSLSQMLKEEKVKIDIPDVEIVSLGELPDHMGGAEEVVAGLYVKVTGDIDLHIIFVLPFDSAKFIVNIVTDGFTNELDELGLSAVTEVTNIVTASYLNAFAELTDMKLIPEPPKIAVDITEAILGTILAELQVSEDFVILVRTAFKVKNAKIDGYLSMIPAKDSFDIVYKKLLTGS